VKPFLNLDAVQQFPLPAAAKVQPGASLPPLLGSHDAAVNMDKLRQLKYRQRAKNSLSILTSLRRLPLLAYRVMAM
jgi:hypothetical protein